MSARYAIYYAPDVESRLWQRASAWLGRDAASAAVLTQPHFTALADLDFADLTADPRHYGFHATLKAPFALTDAMTEADLLAAAAHFAPKQAPFAATIAPRALGPFLAFQIAGPCPEMTALHAACVRAFDGFRAPLAALDLERRRRAGLTPAQDAQLLAWGYPYVFDDFRFHMTLTGAIADASARARVLAAAQDYFADIEPHHVFASICVFRQAERSSPFTIIGRFALSGSPAGY